MTKFMNVGTTDDPYLLHVDAIKRVYQRKPGSTFVSMDAITDDGNDHIVSVNFEFDMPISEFIRRMREDILAI